MKNIKQHFVLMVLVCSLSFSCSTSAQKSKFAQEETCSRGITQREYDLLKGPVKEIRGMANSHYMDTLRMGDPNADPNELRTKHFASWGLDISVNPIAPYGGGGYAIGYRKYDIYGHLLLFRGLDSIDEPIQSRRISEYRYNWEKLLQHQKLRTDKCYPPQIYNPYQLPYTRVTNLPKEVRDVPKDSLWQYSIYNYYFETKDSLKVVKDVVLLNRGLGRRQKIEGNYIKFTELMYRIDTMHTATYKYDDKGRLVRKDITVLKQGGEAVRAWDKMELYENPRHGALLDVPAWMEFEYDDNDNLTRFALKQGYPGKPNKLIIHEDKYYYTEDNVLYKTDRYNVPMLTGVIPSYEYRRVLYYDEEGFIVKSEGYDREDRNKLLRTRLYRYDEHDSYGNWTKMYVYLNGKIEKEPHITATRQITYYEE